jgi:hypothetical protein
MGFAAALGFDHRSLNHPQLAERRDRSLGLFVFTNRILNKTFLSREPRVLILFPYAHRTTHDNEAI